MYGKMDDGDYDGDYDRPRVRRSIHNSPLTAPSRKLGSGSTAYPLARPPPRVARPDSGQARLRPHRTHNRVAVGNLTWCAAQID